MGSKGLEGNQTATRVTRAGLVEQVMAKPTLEKGVSEPCGYLGFQVEGSATTMIPRDRCS